jgi:hypothetical protein
MPASSSRPDGLTTIRKHEAAAKMAAAKRKLVDSVSKQSRTTG